MSILRPGFGKPIQGVLEIQSKDGTQTLRLCATGAKGTRIEIPSGGSLQVCEADGSASTLDVHTITATTMYTDTVSATGDISADGNIVVTDIDHADCILGDDAVVSDTITIQGRHTGTWNAVDGCHEASCVLEPDATVTGHALAPVSLAFGSTNATHDGVYLTFDPSGGAGASLFTLTSSGTGFEIRPAGTLTLGSAGTSLFCVNPDVGDATGSSLVLTGALSADSASLTGEVAGATFSFPSGGTIGYNSYLRAQSGVDTRDIAGWVSAGSYLKLGSTSYDTQLHGHALHLTSGGDVTLHPGVGGMVVTSNSDIEAGLGAISGASLNVSAGSIICGALSASSVTSGGAVSGTTGTLTSLAVGSYGITGVGDLTCRSTTVNAAYGISSAGVGTLTSLAASGNLVTSAGSITATAGSITGTALAATAGGVSATGNLTTSAGNLLAPAGSCTVSGALTGGSVAVSGNVVSSVGAISATTGSIFAAGDIYSTAGNIYTEAGDIGMKRDHRLYSYTTAPPLDRTLLGWPTGGDYINVGDPDIPLNLRGTSIQVNGTALNATHLTRWTSAVQDSTSFIQSDTGYYTAVAHSLGATPTLWGCYLQCISTEGGYVAGTRMNVDWYHMPFNWYINIFADATNVGLVRTTTGTADVALVGTDKNNFAPTPAKWGLYFWAIL